MEEAERPNWMARLVAQVAAEAVDEPDAIVRHPEVVDVVAKLAGRDGLRELFGSNGHDPDAFVMALADGMRPYQDLLLTDAPEIVEDLSWLAVALKGQWSEKTAGVHL
jgi:hypothetical protein